jgi:hypothetical protein
MFFKKKMNGRVHHSIQDSGDGEDTTNDSDNLDKELMPLCRFRVREDGDWVGLVPIYEHEMYLKKTMGKVPRITSFMRTVYK